MLRTAAGAASAVASTPVGVLAFVAAVTMMGGFLGALAAIRRGVIRPLGRAAEQMHDVTSLPELVRDLTATLSRYVAENEARSLQTEARLGRVESLISLWAFRTLGPPQPFSEAEAREAARMHTDPYPREKS